MKQSFPLVPPKYNDIDRLLRDLRARPGKYWLAAGEKRALALFHEMAGRVPAYKDFLKKQRIDPVKVRTMEDFRQVPTIDKNNYLRHYPLEALCWDGLFEEKRWTISATSGSTGEPFYFPRELAQDLQYAGTAELYLRTNFHIDQRSTLYIDAFPMGAWIGGVFTYEVVRMIAERRRYPLSIITPGIDKAAIINSVRKLGDKFDQVVIGCYGPFLKDAIDDGIAQGLDWKRYHPKFVFSAEGFSETFRDYVIDKAGLKNPYADTLNHYGTVDQGTLGYETPLAVFIRRLAVRTPKLYRAILPFDHKLPTLVQYDPELFYFEELENGLLCSAASGLPLVRYDLKDNGGVITYDDMLSRCSLVGHDIESAARRAGLGPTMWRWPFAYVYERKDFSVSLYAFQIYPETIRRAVQAPVFRNDCTGKFAMLVKLDRARNQVLEINIELKANRRGTKKLEAALRQAITRQLLEESSEYRETHNRIPGRVQPRIVFWPYEYPKYFRPGTKQKWVIKQNQI
ncbi:MAG TPA: phenylacetate--CoA ligase family protein [Candidatus Paceibacterota bacterium]|nr:phenylacetate--CoA ligase family protein [Candidatus Paceibacterota bacterium]